MITMASLLTVMVLFGGILSGLQETYRLFPELDLGDNVIVAQSERISNSAYADYVGKKAIVEDIHITAKKATIKFEDGTPTYKMKLKYLKKLKKIFCVDMNDLEFLYRSCQAPMRQDADELNANEFKQGILLMGINPLVCDKIDDVYCEMVQDYLNDTDLLRQGTLSETSPIFDSHDLHASGKRVQAGMAGGDLLGAVRSDGHDMEHMDVRLMSMNIKLDYWILKVTQESDNHRGSWTMEECVRKILGACDDVEEVDADVGDDEGGPEAQGNDKGDVFDSTLNGLMDGMDETTQLVEGFSQARDRGRSGSGQIEMSDLPYKKGGKNKRGTP